jgi:uncharacterized protein (DUF952 family)
MNERLKGYKLTDQNGYTRRGLTGQTKWEIGTKVRPTGEYQGKPCAPGVLHDYEHPLLAILLNPIHANIDKPLMFVLEHDIEPNTDGLKRWTTRQVSVISEMSPPVVTITQRVKWAQACAAAAFAAAAARAAQAMASAAKAAQVPGVAAARWLSGEDRSWAAWAEEAAARAARAAEAAAEATEAGVTTAQLIAMAEEICGKNK